MLNPSPRIGLVAGLPLTATACLVAGTTTRGRVWVQMRRIDPSGPVVLCGQVHELKGSDGNWFKVDTAIGTYWVEGRNVRLCSSDGRCTCEAQCDSAGGAP